MDFASLDLNKLSSFFFFLPFVSFRLSLYASLSRWVALSLFVVHLLEEHLNTYLGSFYSMCKALIQVQIEVLKLSNLSHSCFSSPFFLEVCVKPQDHLTKQSLIKPKSQQLTPIANGKVYKVHIESHI